MADPVVVDPTPVVIPPVVVPPAPVAPWYAGKADAETVGLWQNKGWADKDAATIALEASRSYREAERLVGAPPDKLVRLPDNPNDPGWAKVWERFGAPADGKYDFAGIKAADGTDLTPALADAITKVAALNHLPKDAVRSVAETVVKYMDDAGKEALAQKSAGIATERDALGRNWGPNFEANKFIAQQAAAKLGMTPEEVGALENASGYAKTMDMLRKIGVTMGEDRYVAGQGNTQGGVMTREQADVRHKELMGDKDFTKRYLNGDAAALREMTAINTIRSS